MTSPDDDRELDELLARRSRLSRDYASLKKEEPPAAVDLAILAAAERAARLPERPLAHSRPRWMIPAALAATVVVSFSIIFELGRDPAPIVARMAAGMRGAPPPVMVTLEPPARPAMEPSLPAASPAPPAAQRPTSAPTAATGTARQAANVEPKTPVESRADFSAPAAAVTAPPPAAIAGETALVAAPRDTLERRAADSPAVTDADLERAIAYLRARAAGGATTDAPSAGAAAGAQGLFAKRATDAEARLRDLQRLYDAGDKMAAAAALAEFRQDFPQHPVSQLLDQPRP